MKQYIFSFGFVQRKFINSEAIAVAKRYVKDLHLGIYVYKDYFMDVISINNKFE